MGCGCSITPSRQCHYAIASRRGMADWGREGGTVGAAEGCGGDSTALFMYLSV